MIETIIQEMQKFYVDYGVNKSMDYAFGFFDALSVLRRVQEKANE